MSESIQASNTHLVLIPTYNTGAIVLKTVREALEWWSPVWVVVDGSDDGSGESLEALAAEEPRLRVIRLERNRGKGAAVLHGLEKAEALGFTHVLCLDADGQHPTRMIPEYMNFSRDRPNSMVLGDPVFDETAPAIRVHGRKLSNFWVNVETLWGGIGDSLFGMRVYPVADLVASMKQTRWARRFDFDPEVAVRLAWRGVPPVRLATPVKYLSPEEGGVSQFRYFRDNRLLVWMHLRLLAAAISAWPGVIRRRRRAKAARRQLARDLSQRFPGRFRQGYVRNKIRIDPLYDVVFGELEKVRQFPLMDVGCGIGLLEFFLWERGYTGPITGIEFDAGKVSEARRAAADDYPEVTFEVGDAREGLPEFQGNVVVLDVLQYLRETEQEALLRTAARRVASGGVLVIRNGLADGSWRYWATRLGDRFANWNAWIGTEVIGYPAATFIRKILEEEGMTGHVRPLWGKTPFNNYLLTFRRLARKDSEGGSTQR